MPKYATLLFSKYSELVYGLCLKYFKEEEASKDALMGIYELFLVKLKQHKVEFVKSWLYSMSKNYCIGILRKKQKEQDYRAEYQKHAQQSYALPIDALDKEDLFDKLEECIEALSENQKKCIVLFYLNKTSYKEISSSLGLTWSRVRSLIQNGRRNLKICLENS